MPPPKTAKEARKKHQVEVAGEAPKPPTQQLPKPPAKSQPSQNHASANMLKLHIHGIPTAPENDFPLPSPDFLAGTTRERLAMLCEAMCQQSFIDVMQKSKPFDIRTCDYRNGISEPATRLHFGEVFVFWEAGGKFNTQPHAWVVIESFCIRQFHVEYPACKAEAFPTFLESIESYLMYVFIRLGQKLPQSLFVDGCEGF